MFLFVDVCADVVAKNLQCIYDSSESAGYRLECMSGCQENLSGQEVCASDFGNYVSKCHMQREACKMYGKEIVQRLSVKNTGNCSNGELTLPFYSQIKQIITYRK